MKSSKNFPSLCDEETWLEREIARLQKRLNAVGLKLSRQIKKGWQKD
jgi:hypothetical protein